MKRFLIYLSVFLFCIALGGIGLKLGYKYFNNNTQAPAQLGANAYSVTNSEPGSSTTRASTSGTQAIPPPQELVEPKISADTKMIYEYYYTLDNVSQRTEELAPYFMQGITRDKVSALFTGWDVVSFSSAEVVMRKFINERSVQHYTVGVLDGYVAVFYEGGPNAGVLKELTDKPVKTLSEVEQKRLAAGIAIKGDDMLIKALEDYSS